ncbi:MAG: hypothetical protein IAE98_00355 [Candidatus Kapabacteria bacterium]|nr:hypothetical protein [Candidatus Kapabacteria bacterium]
MATIIPAFNRNDVQFTLSIGLPKVLEDFSRNVIMDVVNTCHTSPLHISEINVVDSNTSDEVVKRTFPNQAFMHNSLGDSKGKCIGLQAGNTITNYIYLAVELFYDLYLVRDNYRDTIQYYVLHHEFGHCYDHNIRSEIISPPYQSATIYNKSLADDYYSYMFRGELSACFHSASNLPLRYYDEHMDKVAHIYKTYHDFLVQRLQKTSLVSNERYIENLYFTVADLSWSLIASAFSQVMGYRIGDLRFNAIPPYCPTNLPTSMYGELIYLEQRIRPIFNYPNFNQAIMTELLITVDRIAALHGCTFAQSNGRDIVLIDGFNR